MSTTFLLAPAAPASGSSPVTHQHAASALNLLPFALGSNTKPYTSTNANVSSHFQPRPAPAGIVGVEEGKTIANFRGRQLVGQHVKVPRGYTGWMLRTDSVEKARLALGMGTSTAGGSKHLVDAHLDDERSGSRRHKGGVNGVAQMHEEDEDLSLKRSPRKAGITVLKQRVVGAGQTALARPKRAVARAVKKRMRLDSDDEDEGDMPAPPPSVTPKKRPGPPLTTPTRQSPRLAKTPASGGGDALALPDITLHEATPLKTPLPPAPKHLKLKKAGARDFVIGRSALSREDEEGVVKEDGVNGKEGIKAEVEGEAEDETDTEDASSATPSETASMGASALSIIPSPATENDPPTFLIESAAPSPAPAADDIKPGATTSEYQVKTGDIDGPVRVLQPTSSFSGFTLWTADTALAGYVEPSISGGHTDADSGTVPADVASMANVQAEGDETGPKVRPGWWASGGAGEGGDGIVRALGEFIGLVEMINEPVHLAQQGEEQDDDDEEDDE